MDQQLWRQDACLACLSDRLDHYQLFSFDVFDTVVFRHCEKPVDVFALVWEEAGKQFPGLIMSPQEYLEERREAERRANRNHHPHHNFEMIFEELSLDPDLLDFLQKEEIEMEKRVLYPNPAVCSLIDTLYEMGKPIILVSDMYHSRAVIRELLECAGIDLSKIQEVYVSSQFSCHKGGGFLFEKVLSRYPELERSRVVHIGDNINGDFKGAVAAGLDAVLYNRFGPADPAGTASFSR